MGVIRTFRRWHARLSVRYTLFLAALILAFAVEFVCYNIVQSNLAIRQELERHAVYLGRFGADLAAQDLADGRLPELAATMRNFVSRSDIVYARLLDRDRRVVTDGAAAVTPSAAPRDDLLDAALRDRATRISDDGSVLDVAEPVELDGRIVGGLRFGVTLAPMHAAVEEMIRHNLIVVALFLLLVLPVTALAAHRATMPIRRLTESTRRIAAGDLSTTIEITGEDEIAELSRSVSSMVESLSESAAAIRSLTFVDQLTGLPNRERLEQRVTAAVGGLREAGDRVALAVVDLDRFKRVNDALGPDHGDLVLREVADRLAILLEEWREDAMRKSGATYETALARLSADEFGVMVAGPLGEHGLEPVLRRILRAFEADFDLDGHALELKASVGVALAPTDAGDFKTLTQNAGVALDAAKLTGGAAYRFFSPDLDERAYRHLVLESDLRQATARGELEVYFQPQVACSDGRGIGAEALIRWNHPTRGVVTPAEFIPLAEESGLIVDIGTFVLRRVCAQAALWASRGLNPRLSVNVSRAQFQREDFPALVLQILADSGAAPSQLELEITESIAMSDPASVAGQMAPLRAAGVRFAMDDFGTGYSSLSVLTRLPFDVLKIDRSFVSGIDGDTPECRVLVRTVLAMARGLGLEVVAEGVETKIEHSFLRDHQCASAQGFLFAAPMPATRFETWFIAHRRRDARLLQARLRTALLELPEAMRV
ncbi:putative bifunctional diguanylate cyclase/phosphodiesterase [Labrys wisconsinensis]|uniref:Diguanylate cyclase (GGDEF)-like protein n=1 Tax=Labrys wisconsinensis TaxID=425677 RepID=A0ABU0JHF4_9HYPH|nr:GGDEF domain-containing protein [Labrys wisconsinensis]MDQ0473723.1 diguanylate cyclase (GGDEF)-like protein [Labrys wisconsinensis]